MNDFPEFMNNPKDRVHSSSHSVAELEGYVFKGADGSQIAIWTGRDAGITAEHKHPFDEYIPAGVPHFGERVAGTHTIHALGGKRAQRDSEDKG